MTPKVSYVAWGSVNSVSPLEVRIAGDRTDTPFSRKLESLPNLAIGDEVVVLRCGEGSWVVIGKVVST